MFHSSQPVAAARSQDSLSPSLSLSLSLTHTYTHRERERERERQTDRQTHTHTSTHTHSQTGSHDPGQETTSCPPTHPHTHPHPHTTHWHWLQRRRDGGPPGVVRTRHRVGAFKNFKSAASESSVQPACCGQVSHRLPRPLFWTQIWYSLLLLGCPAHRRQATSSTTDYHLQCTAAMSAAPLRSTWRPGHACPQSR